MRGSGKRPARLTCSSSTVCLDAMPELG
jgi:hypothetical protein